MSRRAKLDKNGGFATEQPDNFCSRFVEDITGTFRCRPSFRGVDGNRTIDIPASFSPTGWKVWAGKLVTLGLAFYTLYLGFFMDPRIFWLAYLTNWNVTISTVYLMLSFFNSIIPVAAPTVGQTVVGRRVKFTWITFTIAANIGVLLTLAFWTLVYDGGMTLATLFPHGIIQIAVLLDGFGINAIPIRLRHYLEIILPFAIIYMVWSYAHSALGIGNPDTEDEDPETNDDLIYEVLDWKAKPDQTAVVAVLLILVLAPVLQIVLWMVSGCRRRYIIEKESSSYVEMGSQV